MRCLDRGGNGQHPSIIQIHRGAFYRIFLGHQQHAIPRKREITGLVTMVIGKGMCLKIQSKSSELRKETGRIADTGNGEESPPAQVVGLTTAQRVGQG